MRILALIVGAVLMSTGTLAGDRVANTSYAAPDSTRILRHEVTVNASPSEVYRAFTTAEGWRTWAVPFAELAGEFGVGAVLETSYNPAAVVGDPKNIKNRVQAYIPDRMLAFQAIQAPTGFKNANLLAHIFCVAEFESVGADRTHVRLSMLGYARGAGFDELYNGFDDGNAWSLAKLAERFDTGPIDWKKALAKSAK